MEGFPSTLPSTSAPDLALLPQSLDSESPENEENAALDDLNARLASLMSSSLGDISPLPNVRVQRTFSEEEMHTPSPGTRRRAFHSNRNKGSSRSNLELSVLDIQKRQETLRRLRLFSQLHEHNPYSDRHKHVIRLDKQNEPEVHAQRKVSWKSLKSKALPQTPESLYSKEERAAMQLLLNDLEEYLTDHPRQTLSTLSALAWLDRPPQRELIAAFPAFAEQTQRIRELNSKGETKEQLQERYERFVVALHERARSNEDTAVAAVDFSGFVKDLCAFGAQVPEAHWTTARRAMINSLLNMPRAVWTDKNTSYLLSSKLFSLDVNRTFLSELSAYVEELDPASSGQQYKLIRDWLEFSPQREILSKNPAWKVASVQILIRLHSDRSPDSIADEFQNLIQQSDTFQQLMHSEDPCQEQLACFMEELKLLRHGISTQFREAFKQARNASLFALPPSIWDSRNLNRLLGISKTTSADSEGCLQQAIALTSHYLKGSLGTTYPYREDGLGVKLFKHFIHCQPGYRMWVAYLINEQIETIMQATAKQVQEIGVESDPLQRQHILLQSCLRVGTTFMKQFRASIESPSALVEMPKRIRTFITTVQDLLAQQGFAKENGRHFAYVTLMLRLFGDELQNSAPEGFKGFFPQFVLKSASHSVFSTGASNEFLNVGLEDHSLQALHDAVCSALFEQ